MGTDLKALAQSLGPEFVRRYELERPLGAGGMAEVFRGRDVQLGRAVAVKVQRRDENFAEASRERFHFEATAGARIQDENVVRVYEYGEGRGTWWMACELIEGFSLADALDTAGGRFTPLRALDAAVQVARGLKAIHEAGLVHRDLKPENILIAHLDGVHKISDLGLAAGSGRGFQTEAGLVLGTPRYMAPEQVRDKVGPQADLYALGTMIFVMLTGEFPFPAKNELEILSQKVKSEGPPRRVADLRPELDGSLDDLVMQLLQRDTGRRPQSAEAILPLLERLHVKAKEGKSLARSAASRPGSGPSQGRRLPSRGLSAHTQVSRPLSVGMSGSVREALVAVARSPRATGALVAGLALAMLGGIGLGLLWKPAPAMYPAEVRAGEWGAAVRVVVPASSGLPLKPARLLFPSGDPVDGTQEDGGHVFAVGISRLRDLGASMIVEASDRARGKPEHWTLKLELEQAASVRAEWDRRALAVAEIAEKGGLSPAGDPAQDYDPERFEGPGQLPPDVLVLTSDLERNLPPAFGRPYKAWRDLADWMRSSESLENQLRVYRALARWEPGAMEVGRQPKANPRKKPNDPPPRKAHPLVSVLRALVDVRVKYVHESVLGPPSVVTGMSNGANMRWIRNLRMPASGRINNIADAVGSGILADIAEMVLKIVPPGPQGPAYEAKLHMKNFECARLTGRQMIEVDPTRDAEAEAAAAKGRYGLRVSIIDFYPTSAVRLTVPLAAGPPMDFWLGVSDVREHRSGCPENCKMWRHTHTYEIVMPHGMRVADAAKVGLRQGPVIPLDDDGGTKIPCERKESQLGLEREDIVESAYATLVVSDLAWIVLPE